MSQIRDYIYGIRMPDNSAEWVGLNWTTEPPTQEGWYWGIAVDGIIEVLVISIVRDELFISCTGNENQQPASRYTHWLGPLPIPEPPQVTP